MNDIGGAGPSSGRPRLERARAGRMVAGVCEGLGRYFDVDPVIFRIGFAVAAFAGGAGLLAYVLAALVIPEEGSRRAAVHFGRKTPTVVMWVLIVLGVLALTDGWGHRPFGFGWGIVVLAGIGWLIWSHEQRRDTPTTTTTPGAAVAHPPTESRSAPEFPLENASVWEDREPAPAPAPEPERRQRSILGRLTLSVLLVGAGAALLLAQQADDVTGHGVETAFAVGLLVVAAALFVGAWWGRAKPLIAIGVLFTIAAAGASLVDVPLKGGAGDRTWDPVASVRPAYRLGVGDATLDLTNVAVDRVETKASVGIGHLRVVVPHDATVDVDAHAGLGEVRVLGRTADGSDAERSVHEAGSELGPHVTLDVRVGVGQVEVVRDAA
jgi:phage shock protein PspC (stress-responsive transcriptional regulator)